MPVGGRVAFFLVKKEAKKLCLAANYFLLKVTFTGGNPRPPGKYYWGFTPDPK